MSSQLLDDMRAVMGRRHAVRTERSCCHLVRRHVLLLRMRSRDEL